MPALVVLISLLHYPIQPFASIWPSPNGAGPIPWAGWRFLGVFNVVVCVLFPFNRVPSAYLIQERASNAGMSVAQEQGVAWS